MKKSIYLDYAASTPMDPQVKAAIEPYFTDIFYNPSSPYLAGKSVKHALDDARATVARRFGAKPAEIIFTAGATEANNFAIQGVMKGFPEGEVLISSIEHDSIRTPAWLFNCREIPVNRGGLVEPETLRKMISNSTVLVSVGMINNEIGTVQPLREISAVIKFVRTERAKKGDKTPIFLHTDAAQAPSYLDLNTSRLGVDMMSVNGGKIYGPKQSGVLFVKPEVPVIPLLGGGNQEWGMRAGTENVAAIIGLSAALDKAQAGRQSESRRLLQLRNLFVKKIADLIPDARINGSAKHSAPHIVNVTLPGKDNERLMMELDEQGIQCSTGSACHASSAEPSHVLSAIGLSDEDAHASLRFSMGRQTTESDIQKTAQILKKLLS
jgi:cysteine desulfurase